MKRVLLSLIIFLLITTFSCGPGDLFASNKTYNLVKSQNTKSGFTENKGQIIDQNNRPNPAVLFLLNSPGMNVQLRRTGFSYDVYTIDSSNQKPFAFRHSPFVPGNHGDANSEQRTAPNYHFSRIDIDLVGANPACSIIPSDPVPGDLNYYSAYTPVSGIKNVTQYQNITYKDIYPDIDLEFFISEKQGYKYNFLVHPGGKITDIRMTIKGPHNIILKPDSLTFLTSLGNVFEIIPESYFLLDDHRIKIKSQFSQIEEHVYGFSTNDDIPENSTLVIDPTCIRLWGTYYGGNHNDFAKCVIANQFHDLYFAGHTLSTDNIATAGAFESTKRGRWENGFLVKFTANGVRLWGTYFGGDSTGEVIVSGCALDFKGNIYMGGFTTADSGIATPGAHQTVFGGPPWDVFLAKFNGNGERLWATYYGGEDNDDMLVGDGVCTDKYGNVYICGGTSSRTNISTPGSYQDSLYQNLNNSEDAFLAKFDSNGVRQWGTYYGGENYDAFGTCACDTAGIIYVSGSTSSTLNVASPGAFQTVYGGGFETASLVAFTPAGQRIWGTYFGGNVEEEGMICTADNYGFIYLGGYTASTSGISSPGCHQPALGGGYDGFIAKFNNQGQRKWSTYYGGTLDDFSWGFCIGSNGDVFLNGETNSSNNIATSNSYMPVYGGSYDGFLVKFDSSGQRQWGTYFGDIGLDEVNHSIYIPDDTICFAGISNSMNNIATPGAHQTTLGGGSYDAILEKFIECWPLAAGPINGPADECPNTDNVVYSIPTLVHSLSYTWNLPPGCTLLSGSGTTSITVKFTGAATSGFISVRGLNKCNDPGDSASLYVTLHPRPIPVIMGNDTICSGPGKIYTTAPLQTNYQWTVSSGGVISGGGSGTDNSVTVTWNSTGAQFVEVSYTDANGCTPLAPAHFNVFVQPGPLVSVSITASQNNICSGTTVHFTATAVNGGTPSYQWKVNGFSNGPNSNIYSFAPANGDVVTCILTSDAFCSLGNPATSNSISMVVNPLSPVSVNITGSPNPCCAGNSVSFTATPTNGGPSPTFQWKVNGINAGTGNVNYSYIPSNGDVITCTLNSDVLCPVGNPATSNPVTMTVDPYLPVSITVSASDNPFCAGSPVTFSATPANGGANPSYLWKVNGITAGGNSQAFTYSPANGDLVVCILSSSELCKTNDPASSPAVLMLENSNLPAGVTITASSNPFCPGSTVTFTATPSNGGTIPVYQWKVNGTNAGINSPTYSYNPLNGDSVRCILSSNLPCVTGNPASSAKIIMSGTLASVVTFTPCFDTITSTNAKPIKLKGGIPLGGIYSGPGVNSITGFFNPATAGTGTKTITYSYTNVSLCTTLAHSHIINYQLSIFNCGDSLKDIRDNKAYATIQIGTQCWMAANLDYGTEISANLNQRDNCIAEKYSSHLSPLTSHSFYQWDELMQYDDTPASQGLCPPGWHVPTEIDWDLLFTNWTNNAFAASPLKYSGYSGFNALLTGTSHENLQWDYSGFATFFWSSTPHGPYKAWAHGMNDPDASVSSYPSVRTNAFAVRCIKD